MRKGVKAHDLYNKHFTYYFSWGNQNYIAFINFKIFIYSNQQNILSIEIDN